MTQLERRQTDLAHADEMSIDNVLAQVHKVQELMRLVMKDGEHYGVIPGTDKPTLLKPGAEKLCMTFRLNPDYDTLREVESPQLVSYVVKCTLTHIPTGQVWATGLGACNSREKKYRFTSVAMDPQPSWNEQEELKAAGKGYRKRVGQKWLFMQRIENDNAYEYSNTIAKMAAKRALVAAVLNATAASDIFTQDMEDSSESNAGPPGTSKRQPASGTTIQSLADKANELADYAPDLWAGDVLTRNLQVRFGVNSVNDLTEEEAAMVIKGMHTWAEMNPKPDNDPVEADAIEEDQSDNNDDG